MTAEPISGEQQGPTLLAQISNAMVRAQKEFFGKGPTQARSYMLDDMLIVVMRDGLTTAEQTMLRFGHPDQVRQFRQLFQDEMTEPLTSLVRELTGRKVATYQSQVMFDPDVVVDMFIFDSEAPEQAVRATAEGQLEDDAMGQASHDVTDDVA